MKRANASGSITKSKDAKRRKPFRVRVTVKEYDVDTEQIETVTKQLGYYPTRVEAEKALADYLCNPYDLNKKQMTFIELYKLWTEDYFPRLNSESSTRTVESAFNYCSYLYDKPIRSIKIPEIEKCINEASTVEKRGKNKGKVKQASAGTKMRIKSMLNLMFEFASARDLIVKNYAKMFELNPQIADECEANKKEINIFTDEEVSTLWSNLYKVEFVDMILIGIYSGWRPKELSMLKLESIDLEVGTMIGGLKTNAGKNRVVPIHSAIYPLVKARYEEAVEMGSEYLFNDFFGQRGTYMTYDKYRRRFQKVMDRFGMKHRPHEARHTFISLADRYKMDFYTCKRLVGHIIVDITKSVYTHEDIEDIKIEMEKIPKIPTREHSKITWSKYEIKKD